MNRFNFFVIVLVLMSFKTFACLNWELKILKNKVEIYRDRTHQYVPFGHQFKIKDFPALIWDLEKGYEKTKDIDYLSDKGYVLIIQGKYQEALKLYLEIEKIKPNRYSTASNLGTLYELMGENQKSYEWIKKSILLNPESHERSEWLHLKILEAKIQKLQNPSGQFFINTNFGSEVTPKTKLSYKELDKLKHSLYFQLNERISFIKPKDQIISVLLFELGNITNVMSEYNYKDASEIYLLSKQYGFENELLNERLILCLKQISNYCSQQGKQIDEVVVELTRKNNILNWRLSKKNENLTLVLICVIIFSILLIVCLGVFFLKWKKLKKSISTS
jgi:tetratricopeptide (TPR) repeat protein